MCGPRHRWPGAHGRMADSGKACVRPFAPDAAYIFRAAARICGQRVKPAATSSGWSGLGPIATGDTLLFTVMDQEGPACHTGSAGCFSLLDFATADLEAVLRQRVQARQRQLHLPRRARAGPAGGKLREEVDEVIEAAGRTDDLVWECADVLYFCWFR